MSASERLRRSLAASARDAADAPPPPPTNAPTSVTALRREIASRGLDDSECVPADLGELTRFIDDDYNGNRVVIDCTASQEVRATP